MKIKLDENLPVLLAPVLVTFGHDVVTVADEGLLGRSDDVIWNAAQQEKLFLITQDVGFSDRRRFAPGTHAGILLIRLRPPSFPRLMRRLQELFQTNDVEKWAGCIVVSTQRKVRIVRADAE